MDGGSAAAQGIFTNAVRTLEPLGVDWMGMSFTSRRGCDYAPADLGAAVFALVAATSYRLSHRRQLYDEQGVV